MLICDAVVRLLMAKDLVGAERSDFLLQKQRRARVYGVLVMVESGLFKLEVVKLQAVR